MMRKLACLTIAAIAIVAWTPVVSYGASLLFVDDNGNVGIGNITPQHKLDVSGAIYSRLATTTSSVNWNAGNVQSITLTSNTTFEFSNGQAGGQYTLIITQDGSGARTVTWPSSVKWPGGIAPTLTTDANGSDDITFTYDGSGYRGSASLNYLSSPPPPSFACQIGSPDASTIEITSWVGSSLNICYSWLDYACDSAGTPPDIRGSSIFTDMYSAPSGDNTIRYKDNNDNDIHDLHYNGDTHVVSDPSQYCSS